MPKIKTIFAFIALDREPEDEGVVAALAGGIWMPLVAADEARIESLKSIARQIASATRKKIVLAKFSVREDIEEITPMGIAA